MQIISDANLPLAERRSAFSALAVARKDAKLVAGSEELADYLRDLFALAGQPAHPDRLAAIAELIRVRQTFKPLAGSIDQGLPLVLEHPLPDVGALADSRDREYIAMALSVAHFPWIAGFCAQTVMAEETAERAREEFLGRLFSLVGLAEGLMLLTANADRMSLAAENTAESGARRISRLLAAILSCASSLELRPTEGFSGRVDELVRRVFEVAGLPGAGAARHHALVQLVRLIGWTARSRASLAVLPETYEPLKFYKRSYGSIGWDSKAESVLAPIVEDIEDALVLQGRQGIASSGLVDQHRVVVGNPSASRQRLILLADEHPELPENIRHWLRRGELRGEGADHAFGEGSLAALDLRLAEALLESTKTRLEPREEEVLNNLINSTGESDSELAALLRDAVSAWQAMGVLLTEMVAMRELALRGEVGAIEEFDPKYFEASAGVVGSRMRIDRPAVVRRTAGGADGACVRRGAMS